MGKKRKGIDPDHQKGKTRMIVKKIKNVQNHDQDLAKRAKKIKRRTRSGTLDQKVRNQGPNLQIVKARRIKKREKERKKKRKKRKKRESGKRKRKEELKENERKKKEKCSVRMKKTGKVKQAIATLMILMSNPKK